MDWWVPILAGLKEDMFANRGGVKVPESGDAVRCRNEVVKLIGKLPTNLGPLTTPVSETQHPVREVHHIHKYSVWISRLKRRVIHCPITSTGTRLDWLLTWPSQVCEPFAFFLASEVGDCHGYSCFSGLWSHEHIISSEDCLLARKVGGQDSSSILSLWLFSCSFLWKLDCSSQDLGIEDDDQYDSIIVSSKLRRISLVWKVELLIEQSTERSTHHDLDSWVGSRDAWDLKCLSLGQ